MKFIDLFAGLGGFHIALTELGHECVFSCEKKPNLQSLYNENFGIKPLADIRSLDSNQKIGEIPDFDVLCAGFPCQPFSMAGSQKGFRDENNGNLFFKITEILEVKKPQYFILENVKNIYTHNNGLTFKLLCRQLNKLGYSIKEQILSPHQFGIPQHRERLFLVGSKTNLSYFEWPTQVTDSINLDDYFLKDSSKFNFVEPEKVEILKLWQEFLDCIDGRDLPAAPIWAMEFGATYPYESSSPLNLKDLSKYQGNFGRSLEGLSRAEQLQLLPNYAIRNNEEFPTWKKRFIKHNRDFYQKHKSDLKLIVDKISKLESQSFQKFEWNIKSIKTNRKITEHFIQFRGSGIRVKSTNFFPSLVTVSAQIPIIGKEMRYISKEEGAKLQSLESIKLPEDNNLCFHALGNAVNAKVVKLIAESLIK